MNNKIITAGMVALTAIALAGCKTGTGAGADAEVDSRPVVIPSTKGRIMRHRPKLETWQA